MTRLDRTRVGGGALVVGYVLVLALLFRDPGGALAAATAGPEAAAYFLVLPTLGVIAGLYAFLDGPLASAALFAFGSYLGVFGLGLAFGTLLSPAPVSLPLGVGLLGLALAVAALAASVLELASVLGPAAPRIGVD
ncbi:hypothetical protein [Halorubrum sp. BOL3-1]|uniref:hypothetical protein n=1 Tax=Halorubrum sp. BOL3-1 TaxID=2497325 RepID=UPI001F4FE693|nr:hypothetical protein [Halorubrum sp. BOL3-1]